jgi:hypothetical protein
MRPRAGFLTDERPLEVSRNPQKRQPDRVGGGPGLRYTGTLTHPTKGTVTLAFCMIRYIPETRNG